MTVEGEALAGGFGAFVIWISSIGFFLDLLFYLGCFLKNTTKVAFFFKKNNLSVGITHMVSVLLLG